MAHQLRVLGSPEVIHRDGHRVSLSLGKPLALLIYVASSSSPVSRDEVADLLWPEGDRSKGRHSVRQALWVLRSAIGEDLFESHDPLSLKEEVLELDVQRFNEAISEGRIEDARLLWRGPVLDHFLLAGVRHWNHWAEELRSDLEHRFCKALLRHAHALTEQGEADSAIRALDQAIEVAPAFEAPHLARIELLLDLLRLSAAREALSDAHQVLGDQAESVARLALMDKRLEQIARDQRARITEGESFPLEFVGRSRELAGLHTLWRDADLGRTRVGVITGPSGIGKTRLAQELLTLVSVSESRSVSIKGSRGGVKLRWGAASDFVRQLLRLPGSAGISSASDSLLRTMLPSLGRDPLNLQAVNGVSPAAILDAVSDLLEAITFEAPLAVMVDDFQWMDEDSRTLFLGLANRCREIRVLFLILGRSDLSSRHWEAIKASLVEESGARPFLLKPLIEEEVGELLALGAAFAQPEDAPQVVARIHRASGGNPLFIREILREFGKQGMVRKEDQGWVFHSAEIPEDFDLPENLRILLQERLDRLSEAAAGIASTLAKENRKTSSEALQIGAQLPSAVFSEAVAELLRGGVIEWVDGTSLDFVHDVLRDTAAAHLAGSLPDPPDKAKWLRKNQGILALAFGILIALPAGVLWGRGALPWETETAPLPYGGGTIVFQQGENPPRSLRILRGPWEEWERTELDPAPPSGTRFIHRAAGGGFNWFGADDTDDGPKAVRITRSGDRIPLFPDSGDQSLLDPSPDGSRFLLTVENVGRERFSHSLYWTEIWPEPVKHLIYEGSGPVALARWSPDGDMVAFKIGAASDSLAVYSLTGERLWARAFGEIYSLSWCGGGIVLAAAPEEEVFLFRVDLSGEEVTPIGPLALGRAMACSPDQKALLQVEVVEGRPAFILRDLETGRVHPFLAWDVLDASPVWIPDAVSVAPLGVRAAEDTVRIKWGEVRTLDASVVRSDRTESPDGIWWESLNPDVANFNHDQALTGNQAGETYVLARWRHSFLDTIVVIVEDDGSGSPSSLLTERWEKLDSARWVPFGSHPPSVKSVDGNPVLQLLGDEKYGDGLMLREAMPLDQGATVEFEFRMELTENVHQNIGLCLRDVDPATFDLESGSDLGGGNSLCFLYPARELEKMDPSDVSFRVSPGVEERAHLPEALPSSDWTHVAIQVRLDGESNLVINREQVATSPILIPTHPTSQWTVIIDADAVGTEVLVRNFNVWRGSRY